MRRSPFPQNWIKMRNITEDSEPKEDFSVDEEEEKLQTLLKEERIEPHRQKNFNNGKPGRLKKV